MTTNSSIAEYEARLLLADTSPEADTSAILERLLADDVIMIGPDGAPVARSFILEAHRPPRRQTFSSVTVTDEEIRDFGDTAVVSGLAEYRTTEERIFSLRFLRLWRRTDNGWLVVAGSITGVAAA